MAEATHTSNIWSNLSDRIVVTTQFTSPTNGQTWDTGLTTVDSVTFTILEATGAGTDAIGIDSIAGGVVTIEIVGTVGAAHGIAIGV